MEIELKKKSGSNMNIRGTFKGATKLRAMRVKAANRLCRFEANACNQKRFQN
jgi:hypothetical protein